MPKITPFKPISERLQTLKNLYKSHYYFSDDNVIDVVLAIVAGNHFTSDPIWLHLISPPSGGKTELLNSIMTCEEVVFVSDLTPNALISGYKDPPKKDEQDTPKDYSYLPFLNNKTLVTKDFTLIHDKPSETRSQILSILRDCYDGHSSRVFGNAPKKSFKSKFNYLTGMTPDIEKSWSMNSLGARFLHYNIIIQSRREHARQAILNSLGNNDIIRETLQASVKKFISQIPKTTTPGISEELAERVIDLADILTVGRTHISREKSNNDLLAPPAAELSPRVVKQLLRVGQSVALVRGSSQVGEAELEIMKKIVIDSLPFHRRDLLKAFWDRRDHTLEIVDLQGIIHGSSKSTITRNVKDLVELGIVKESKQAGPINPETGKNTFRKLKEGYDTRGNPPYCYRLSSLFFNYIKNNKGL